MFNSIVVSF